MLCIFIHCLHFISYVDCDAFQNLKEVLAAVIPEHRKTVKEFVAQHGNHKIADVTVEQVVFSFIELFTDCDL